MELFNSTPRILTPLSYTDARTCFGFRVERSLGCRRKRQRRTRGRCGVGHVESVVSTVPPSVLRSVLSMIMGTHFASAMFERVVSDE